MDGEADITVGPGTITVGRPSPGGKQDACTSGSVEVHRTSPATPEVRFGPTPFQSGESSIVFGNLPAGTYEVTVVCAGSSVIHTYTGWVVPAANGPGGTGGPG